MNSGDSPSPLRQGQRLDRYDVIAPLARGSLSSVWIGRMRGNHGIEKLVAIRAIAAPLAHDPKFRAAFIEEIGLASAITHPNVAQVLDFGEREDLLYAVTEYVDGDSLADLRAALAEKKQKIPPAIVLRVLAESCAALHAAHLLRDRTGKLLNVVHGDVSSHVIVLSTNGVAKVVDFGVSKAMARVTGMPNGRLLSEATETPSPPAGQKLDRHADIWAIGAILHQLLSHMIVGVKPTGTDPGRAPSVPGAVAELIHRALATTPSERFATAAEMQGAIEAAMVSLGIPTTSANVAAFAAEHLADRAGARAQSIELGMADAPTPLLDSIGPIASTLNPPMDALALAPMPAPLVRHAAVTEARPEPSHALFAPIPTNAPIVTAPTRTRTVATGAIAAGSVAALAAIGFAGMQLGRDRKPPAAAAVAVAQPSVTALPPKKPTCPAGMQTIGGGKFYMGSDDDLELEKPAHHVTLSPYCIDTFEVSVEQYKACSDSGDCKRAAIENKWDGITKQDAKTYDPLCNFREPMARAKHPINCIDWSMAGRYCEAQGKRLPTEAEWEFAARGPDGRKYPWGDEEPGPLELNACGRECTAWARKNHVELEAMYDGDDGWPNTAPVGSFPAGKSRYGVQDVVGNVWEWTSDYFAPYVEGASIDPRGPLSGEARVIRGGAWNGSFTSWVRPTFRYKNAPDTRSYGVGFRCAKPLM